MKKLIIHLDDCPDVDWALNRVRHCLPPYWEKHPDVGQRITVRFDGNDMFLYHDMRKDLAIFTQEPV